MSFKDFKQIETLFSSKGVETLYIKKLAPKQDNEKNQIYLGSGEGTNSIINLFPATLSYGLPSTSLNKRKSKKGEPKIEVSLNFHWLSSETLPSSPAPRTKIINYFQYPEARLSGFLQSCKNPPNAIRRKEQAKYGKRILILGASKKEGITYGLLLTELEDPLVLNFPEIPVFESIPILLTHAIGANTNTKPKDKLLSELSSISNIWHPSIILKDIANGPIAFKGNQGAGYTLEALLNVSANSSKEPDKYGFEIKAFKAGGKISLMTPTADCGSEGELSFKEFMQKHGWPGVKGDGRIVFNGVFRYHQPNKKTKHFLEIEGFDQDSKEFSNALDSIIVCLINDSIDEIISGWTFQKLLDGWSKKHMSACYVEYEKRPYSAAGHDAEYRFTGKVFICEGTTIFNYLKAIANNFIYYDPGHEIKADGTPKVRPQWRISVTKKIRQSFNTLYKSVQEESL